MFLLLESGWPIQVPEDRNMRIRDAALATLMGVLCLESSGCTAIGFLIGSASDDRHASPDTLRNQKGSTLTSGEQVAVLTKDSTVVNGTFLRIENTPPEVYHSQYDNWRAGEESCLFEAALGDSITTTLNSETIISRITGEFAGFTETMMIIRREVGPPYGVVETRVNLRFVDSVFDRQGNCLGGLALRRAIDSGEIPIARQLVVRQGEESIHIPLHMVLRVDCVGTIRPAWGRIIGSGLGFVVDTAILVVGASSLNGLGHMQMKL